MSLAGIQLSSVGGASLDLIYHEVGSNKPKEAFWLGDGMQIWLQLLLHLFRLRSADVIVLDEPDVFLHSDLQRRLVDLLESIGTQVITATHSPEVLAEADTQAIVWVSRNRKRAMTAPKDRLLGSLSDALGTQFNLRLARTLRTKCVLFVEGKDAKLLRLLANTVGATHIEREDGLTIVSLEGIDRADHLDAFAWLIDDVLEKSVKAFVVLDRDYRDTGAVKEIERRLRKSGVSPHFWERHELENYLLAPGAIARVSGADEAWIEEQIAILVDGFEDEVYSGIYAEHQRRLRRTGVDDGAIGKQAKRAADAAWAEVGRRIELAPGKELLGALNQSLQAAGCKTLRARDLSRELAESEIPSELRRVLREIDAACS